MMLMPRRNDFDLWDDLFNDPFFTNKPVVKNMKTDIIEKDNSYLLNIDLPGYDKSDIKISVEDGYLTINAKKEESKEEKNEGNFIRRERYSGECSRSFYIGEELEAEDIKASFKNGILSLDIPKQEDKKQIPEKKYIEIDD
ncbi:MAG: Hsp20/alpha crystallin family protein [Bacilli bacterium]|nr:Hsp20/alpha crystallin family protein [Bacilli bacterium]